MTMSFQSIRRLFTLYRFIILDDNNLDEDNSSIYTTLRISSLGNLDSL